MSQVDEIMKQYAIGTALVEQFHAHKDADIKATLRQIFATNHPEVDVSLLLGEHSEVERVIRNEKIHLIRIGYYDSVIINPHGIVFNPEHGNSIIIVKFTETFKMDTL